MTIENLRSLADRAEGVEGRQAQRLDQLHGRIRTARRRRAVTTSVAAFTLVGAFVAAGALAVGGTNDTREQLPQNTPTPTPGEVEVPDGQATVTAQIAPGDIGDWELKGSIANAKQETDLALTVEARTLNDPMTPVVAYCNGTPETWWVITYDLDGVLTGQPQDGQLSGTRGMSGQCAPDAPTALAPPLGDIDGYRASNSPQDFPLRMFVTKEISADARRCLVRSEDAQGCITTYGLAPSDVTAARFGLGVYEYRPGPTALDVLGSERFEARAVRDRVEFLVDRAVVAARGSDQLVVTLPDSGSPRLVEVVARGTEATELCARAIDIEVVSPETEIARSTAFERRCVPTLALHVDEALAYEQSGEEGMGRRTYLAPGQHVVTVDVVRNDPSNVRYALVIWEARP